MGRLDEAEQIYREVITKHPGNYRALNNPAYLLAEKQKQPAPALPLGKRPLKLNPSHAAILHTVGWTYHLLGKETRALKHLQRPAHSAPGTQELSEHPEAVRSALAQHPKAGGSTSGSVA